jgi:hypothetical protein
MVSTLQSIPSSFFFFFFFFFFLHYQQQQTNKAAAGWNSSHCQKLEKKYWNE